MDGLSAQNLIEGFQFTDIRDNRILDMPVVDAGQVEGYELLYATPGTGDIAEIAGHLLLRVRLRDVPDDQDLVISFLADTGGVLTHGSAPPPLSDCRNRNWFNLLQTPARDGESPWESIRQSLRGLTGGFPVILDIQTLAYTLKSYTVEQDRNLLRYRLMLSDEQRTTLTDYLIQWKDQPPPRYYFFHQNCGSVLIRVVGEGIEKAATANFRPWVSPPHSLCALMIREGLAERVLPDFHSTRTKGDLYRNAFREHYPRWIAEHPELPWPELGAFLHRKVENRVPAIQQLEAVALADPNTLPLLLSLGPLLQQMELATDVRSGLCRDLTSPATTAARELQADLMRQHPDVEPVPLFADVPPLDPPLPAHPGSPHTRLFAWEVGGVWLEDRPGGTISGRLLKQDMGSRSALAMQRAGALTLGEAALVYTEEGIEEWNLTGLSLKKFLERAGRVPGGLTSTRGWGMGLKVLELQKRSAGPDLQGRVAGISARVNLISSESHRQYLMLGAGLDAGWSHDHDTGSDWGVYVPIEAESLLSAGPLQWRNRLSWNPNHIHDAPIELSFRSDLAVPLGEWGKTEVILHCTADTLYAGDSQRTLASLSLEFNRW
ncbi:MAG: DUF4105 domain-containing protein [Kiritimatiellae bacterium]|nr:DUF4105 domain-containing protein [Kiritimatiellia bacterium]